MRLEYNAPGSKHQQDLLEMDRAHQPVDAGQVLSRRVELDPQIHASLRTARKIHDFTALAVHKNAIRIFDQENFGSVFRL